jgi:ABC-type uncharacterized transport system substrate-binding protein
VPRHNITGFSFIEYPLLLNPDNASSGKMLKETANAAQALRIEVLPLYARNPSEFEQAFKSAVDGNVGAIFIAKQFGVDPGTVQRISRPFATSGAASVAA